MLPAPSRVEPRLRPENSADETFLAQVYSATRAEEMALVDWSEQEKAQFLEFQFQAQRQYYLQHFPEASFDVIEHQKRPIGRLYVDRRSDEIRVIDIALLPEARGHGVGSRLMRQILSEAASRRVPVRIHVERTNRAKHLYDRLGFVKIEEQGVYDLMEWRPAEHGPDGDN